MLHSSSTSSSSDDASNAVDVVVVGDSRTNSNNNNNSTVYHRPAYQYNATMTQQPPTRQPPKIQPSSANNNNFLFGGSYYPEKNQKRKLFNNKKRRWNKQSINNNYFYNHLLSWYNDKKKIGIIIIIVLSLLICYFIIIPILLYCSNWYINEFHFISSSSVSSNSNSNYRLRRKQQHDNNDNNLSWLLNDATLFDAKNGSQQQYIDLMEKMAIQRHNQRRKKNNNNIYGNKWLQTLEQIEPKFYNRFNIHHDDTENDVAVESSHKEEVIVHDNNIVPNNHSDGPDTSNHHARIFRTLHNSDDFALSSRCSSSNNVATIQTTLVIQCSYDRVWILKETCQRWFDPMVVVVAIPPPLSSNNDDDEDAAILLTDAWKQQYCPQMNLIQYHLTANDVTTFGYPVNMLRNMALDAVVTNYVLVIDIDFVPSSNLQEDIRTAVQQRSNRNSYPKKEAIVIPAFEKILNKPECNTLGKEETKSSRIDCQPLRYDSTFLPNNISSLQDCYSNSKECIVFQSNNNYDGHSSTRTDLWFEQQQQQNTSNRTATIFRSIDCFDSLRYEPYVVIPWCPMSKIQSNDSNSANNHIDAGEKQEPWQPQEQRHDGTMDAAPMIPMSPYYDERFYGYGKNKIQYVSHLRMAGYQFYVLPFAGFVIHNPHRESPIKNKWNDVQHSTLHRTMDQLYNTYLLELEQKYSADGNYSNATIIRQCNKSRRKKIQG